jgi:hypothetical protein
MIADAPVLSTAVVSDDRAAGSSVDECGNQVPGCRYFVPGRRVRNDGVSVLTLLPYRTCRLAHDGAGWLFWAEFEKPHRYLVDDALEYSSSLPGTSGPITLMVGCKYEVA